MLDRGGTEELIAALDWEAFAVANGEGCCCCCGVLAADEGGD
jgi:hypothetical protein